LRLPLVPAAVEPVSTKTPLPGARTHRFVFRALASAAVKLNDSAVPTRVGSATAVADDVGAIESNVRERRFDAVLPFVAASVKAPA